MNSTPEIHFFARMLSRAATVWAVTSGLVALLTFWAGFCCAAEYHVDARHSSADDSNPGTISRPWKTLSRANASVQPGDTVFIHRGRYAESIAPVESGEASQPITYKAHKNGRVILEENPNFVRLVRDRL